MTEMQHSCEFCVFYVMCSFLYLRVPEKAQQLRCLKNKFVTIHSQMKKFLEQKQKQEVMVN